MPATREIMGLGNKMLQGSANPIDTESKKKSKRKRRKRDKIAKKSKKGNRGKK